MIRLNNETVIFEDKLYSNQVLTADFTPYKRLLITYNCYYYTGTNTGGTSNIIMLDLTNSVRGGSAVVLEEDTEYIATCMHPYNMYSTENANLFMGIACKVSVDKTSFVARFMYNNEILDETDTYYYVSKIVGVTF